jgi:hypothetical protein
MRNNTQDPIEILHNEQCYGSLIKDDKPQQEV